VPLNQISVVLGVVGGERRVIACESAHRVDVRPKRKRDDLGLVIDRPVQDPRARVARRLPVVLDPGLADILDVFGGSIRPNGAAPDAITIPPFGLRNCLRALSMGSGGRAMWSLPSRFTSMSSPLFEQASVSAKA
jgi:hypothetical protein